MNDMLSTLMRYQAWADAEFFDSLARVDAGRHAADYRTMLGLLDHIHVVARIFAAHLTGAPHGFERDRSDPVPALSALSEATERTHQWYLAYVAGVDRDRLREPVCFTFTDGDKGCMTREEMLAHVLLHGAVHRGEVARILSRIGAPLPWDTLAVHLHRAEPARRRMEGGVLATA